MSIIVKQISYMHPDREPLFENISFSVSKGQKISLIGNNGSGKSTLLRIIAGGLQPSAGEIICQDNPYYIPQHFGQYDQSTVAQALHIDQKLEALHAILGGDASPQNFSVLNDDWDIEERALNALAKWGLPHIQLSRKMESMSGGEKTKAFLAGINIHSPENILLDEPSNHLDKDSRKQLYNLIENSNATIVVVSHDRTLLNLIELTYELTHNDIEVYGGNYEFYKVQKEEKMEALQSQLDEKQKELRKARNIAREVAEKKQKRDVRGKKSIEKKGIPRIMLNTIRNRAESSSAKLKETHEGKMESIVDNMKQLRQQLPEKKDLKMDFEDANLHAGKILVTAQDINFGYADQMLWENPLEFEIRSGDRIVVSGQNGSGKTTLLKLIFGKLEPQEGSIIRADFKYLYIDQDYSIIDNSLTVFEQLQQFNSRRLTDDELRIILHRFLFTYNTWEKPCGKLSGGEKMRLVFCCMQADDNAPDMFILDEPTNNLDIQSLEIVTNTIKEYKGTLLIISHDAYFVEEVGVSKEIEI
ncbi:ABC transporter ATP-binding protein [Dysgonomonas sp. 521]|uniref:ribosomal protection-like ABC-F family protein n=1 Tax=Dysgonomonas sp. 521 TaxID=2302932 RepID=UPI0013D74BA5|nr:ABC-F family ATP-binding cassette domain-containing protein [Dysgonomonas sp. 521]NDV97398.1 ABC transporter ATP-binding protein [Dysgonomonas sp. 521]